MRLPQPNHAYALLWEALTGEKRGADAAARLLDKRFSSGEEQEERVVVLVDELDYMLTQRQEVLYNLFEWPGRKNAGLAVIGIANTLGLPERLDPKVRRRGWRSRIWADLRDLRSGPDRVHPDAALVWAT